MNPAFSKPAMAAGKSSRCSRRSTSGVLRTAVSSARETQAAADVVHGVTHANPGDRSKDGSHRRHLLANVPWIRGFCLKLSCSTQRGTFFNRAYGRWSWRYFFGHNVPRIPLLSRSPRTLLSQSPLGGAAFQASRSLAHGPGLISSPTKNSAPHLVRRGAIERGSTSRLRTAPVALQQSRILCSSTAYLASLRSRARRFAHLSLFDRTATDVVSGLAPDAPAVHSSRLYARYSLFFSFVPVPLHCHSPLENHWSQRQCGFRSAFFSAMARLRKSQKKHHSSGFLGMQHRGKSAHTFVFCNLPKRFCGSHHDLPAPAHLPAQPLLCLAGSSQKKKIGALRPSTFGLTAAKAPSHTACSVALSWHKYR